MTEVCEDYKPGKFVWEIEPHPYDSSLDVFVTNSDDEALAAMKYAAEMHLWNDSMPGEERTLKVRHNKESTND